MRQSIMETLTLFARSCECFSSFYEKISEEVGVIEAERVVSMEFRNLKVFYEWAQRRKDESSETVGVEPGEKELVVHPTTLRLKDECEALRKKLEEALFSLNELVISIIPNLKALYMIKVGSAEIELLQLKIEIMKLRRTIEIIQAHLNRGEKPDLASIEAQLDKELEEWKEKVWEKVNSLDEARKRLKCLMTDEESACLKALYRALVKRLHPDVNPRQTEKEKDLWLRLQRAYENGDIEEMRLIEVLVKDCKEEGLLSDRSGIEEWEHMRETLKKKHDESQERITALKAEFPYVMKDRIENEAWVTAHNRETRCRIEEEITLKSTLSLLLEKMKRVICSE